jgi:hypothetical protein
MRNLLTEASNRLKTGFQRKDVEPVLGALEALASRIDFQHPRDGVALFASRETSSLHYLPFPVRERIVIDETFATRDLVFSLNRSPSYWVVSLNEKPTRLFHAVRDHLAEIGSHGFPMSLENPLADDKTPQGNMVSKPGHRDERLRNFFRHVDTALSAAIGPESIPIVLVGVASNVAFFSEVSRHRERVLTTLPGNHDADTPHALGAIVWPQVEAALEKGQVKVFKDLEAALGAKRVATGLNQAWPAALEGRGGLLVVEKDFHQAGRLARNGLMFEPLDKADGPGSMDDAVDELIETVFLKGGRVVFVNDGTLAHHDRVALTLRY